MRISPEEHKAIKEEAKALFGKDVLLRLFGSRVDDNLRGGDIDLHIEVESEYKTLRNEIAYELRLIKVLGERKIDIILHDKNKPAELIDKVAIEKGVVL